MKQAAGVAAVSWPSSKSIDTMMTIEMKMAAEALADRTTALLDVMTLTGKASLIDTMLVLMVDFGRNC